MGLRGDCSNGPDSKDVAAVMEHLEHMWQQPIKVTLLRTGSGKFANLLVIAEAIQDHLENGDLLPSACVKLSMSTIGGGDLLAVLHSALYQLDFAVSDARESLKRTE